MEKPRLLPGEALVAKGITKTDATLPELGLKDVTPNGSWLEQKQIQAALEARKYSIEVERIEKQGTLSHAEWRDDLMLAEVTQMVGGHWQYLGHNIGKIKYIRPEEILFLMEVNCLLLKHNEVTVSLQKAYALLLNSSTTMLQYKVYASLSRLGYKVFRHKALKGKSYCHNASLENKSQNIHSPIVSTGNQSENVNLPSLHKYNESECIATTISIKNDVEYIDSSMVKTENIHQIIQTVNTSEHVATPINPVNVADDVVHANNKSTNIEQLTRNIDVKSETVDSLMSNIVHEAESYTSQAEGDSTVLSESNKQEVTDSQTSNFIAVINKNNEEIITKTDAQIHVANAIESPVKMDVVYIGINSADDVSQCDTTQYVSSSVEYDKEVKKNMDVCQEPVDSGIVLMQQEHDDRDNNITEDDTAPENTDTQSFDNNRIEESSNTNNSKSTILPQQNLLYDYLRKIEKLTKRQLKPCNSKSIQKYFENIPDLYKKQLATVNVPEQEWIPKNIYVNNSSYLLNIENIKRRSKRSASTESASYTSSDEANETNVRRIRNTEYSHNLNFSPHLAHHHFRPYGFWRPQNNLNYYQFSMFFQRPSFSNMFFQSRVQYIPRPNHVLRSFSYPGHLSENNPNISQNSRKRMRTGRTAHLQAIKNLAVRLKQFVMVGNSEMHSLESLHNQLHSYNIRYKTRLRLTDNFDVVNEEKIVETIELDDDEESKSKKSRLDSDQDDKFDENLYRLRLLALKLKDLEARDKATASHRRAFSKALKTFNKSYNTDMYLNDSNYEVIDRSCITVNSSSESDCVVEEKPKVSKGKGKRLRNPFNILKRRSERLQSTNNPSTSKDDNGIDTNKTEPNRLEAEGSKAYKEHILKTFDKAWLPSENDFGRAEIVPNQFMNARLADSSKEQYIFDFMKDQFHEYQNWLEAKVSFLRHLDETNIAYQNEQARLLADSELCNTGLRPLINSDDNLDMPSMLQKLRIIKNNKDYCSESSLAIDFDVYNRNVQNFRKTSPPKPHFRIICLDQSSSFPSAAQVMSLHSKYDDNVTIVFAIVGIDSVSYIRVNPIDLPIYVPSNDV